MSGAAKAVVFDITGLVGAVVGGNSPFRSWPSPPPASDNPFADCVGIVNDARECSLFLCEHVIRNVVRVLVDDDDGFGWDAAHAEDYVDVLMEIAEASGGGTVEPHVRVSDCADFEDNRILELALAADADLIVSEDTDLTSMSPWRGMPIIRPAEFAGRIDARRRAARRSRGRSERKFR